MTTRDIGRAGSRDAGTTLFLTADRRAALAARIAELDEAAAALLLRLRDGDGDDVTALEYGRVRDEANRLRSALEEARPADELEEDSRTVVLGDTVTLRFDDGTLESYVVVHPLEAPYDDVLLSSDSPLAQAVLGRRVGEEVEVEAPAGAYRCTIESADRH